MIRKFAIPAVASLVLFAGNNDSKVEKFGTYQNAFQYDRFIIAGQPTLEMIQNLKKLNISLVINLREPKENKEFEASAFNEEQLIKDTGINYISLPFGEKQTFCPATVDSLTKLINDNSGKIFIHCHTGNRATLLFMAYLIKNKIVDINTAIDIGKNMKFAFPLQDLLGNPISFSLDSQQIPH